MKKGKKQEKENLSKAERTSNKINDLEEDIRYWFEETGLINHIKFKYNSKEKEYYIEYKTGNQTDNKPRGCKLLRDLMLNRIASHYHPEINGIEYKKPYPETYRAKLIINPAADIYNPDGFITDILTDIKRCLEVYNKKRQ